MGPTSRQEAGVTMQEFKCLDIYIDSQVWLSSKKGNNSYMLRQICFYSAQYQFNILKLTFTRFQSLLSMKHTNSWMLQISILFVIYWCGYATCYACLISVISLRSCIIKGSHKRTSRLRSRGVLILVRTTRTLVRKSWNWSRYRSKT